MQYCTITLINLQCEPAPVALEHCTGLVKMESASTIESYHVNYELIKQASKDN